MPVRLDGRPPLPSRGAIAVTLLTFAVVFAALRIYSYTQKSATFDEPLHLAAGYAAVAHADFRMDPTHPPLVRMWAALPLLVLGPPAIDLTAIDRITPDTWPNRATPFASQFMYDRNDGDRLLYAGRFMIVLLGVATGVLIFCWTLEWLGFIPALFALAFYTMLPGTHAGLVTTDLGVSCFMFGAVYFLWRVCRAFTPWNLLGASLCPGLAVATKFSAVLLAPIFAVLLVVAVWRRPEFTWRRAGIVASASLVATFAVIWIAYGFRYAPSANGRWLYGADHLPMVQEHFGAAIPLAQWIDARHLLPNAFTHGFLLSLASVRLLPSFLSGQISQTGSFLYFPVAFVLKTPLALLALFAIGLTLLLVRRWRTRDLAEAAWLLVPIAVVFGVAVLSRVNLGLRHVLPIYPFVLIVAATAVPWLLQLRRAGRVVLAMVTVFWAVQFGVAYPHTLAFFNPIVGAEEAGTYLTDSNLDWGQDLKPLKVWMDERGVSRINLAYFGTADPDYYHINARRLPGAGLLDESHFEKPELPGYVAISATVQSGVYLPKRWRLFYRAVRQLKPVATIGRSIRVYWMDKWPEVPLRLTRQTPDPADLTGLKNLAAATFRLQWYGQAIRQYRLYLKYQARDLDALDGLGEALVRAGDHNAAIDTFTRATAIDPANVAVRRSLTAALLLAGHPDRAAAEAQALIRLSPASPSAYDLLGRALGSSGRMADAVRAFERALALDPTFAPAAEALRQIQRPPPEPPGRLAAHLLLLS
ncbi:MAG TPA: tetratricopeptide repeat protein [Vicinamibacterales bacterium]|nr:tetratricopeptide repeat protein [Vicinamibacterales bacterium]